MSIFELCCVSGMKLLLTFLLPLALLCSGCSSSSSLMAAAKTKAEEEKRRLNEQIEEGVEVVRNTKFDRKLYNRLMQWGLPKLYKKVMERGLKGSACDQQRNIDRLECESIYSMPYSQYNYLREEAIRSAKWRQITGTKLYHSP